MSKPNAEVVIDIHQSEQLAPSVWLSTLRNESRITSVIGRRSFFTVACGNAAGTEIRLIGLAKGHIHSPFRRRPLDHGEFGLQPKRTPALRTWGGAALAPGYDDALAFSQTMREGTFD
jgi:hypothetical protein